MTRRSFVKETAVGAAGAVALGTPSCTTNPADHTGISRATKTAAEPASISSVRGFIKPGNLGATLMHEHIVWLTPGIRENWPEYFDEKACLETAKKKLEEAAARGIQTVVDLTPPDAGRNIQLVKKIQDSASINIILCTGMYWNISLFWQFKDADEMAAAFIKDIKNGIQGSEVKAGILKLATDLAGGGLNEENEKCLRAGARAHRATGVPISTHTGPPSLGLDQQRIFHEEGVDLSRVIIGHIGDSTDVNLQKQLMDKGSIIGMDRFGLYTKEMTFKKRADAAAKLCKEGYADRMVLSHDHWCWHDWDFAKKFPGFSPNNITFTHISDDVLPALRERGVSEAHIDQMLVKNPLRILEKQRAY